MGTIVVPLFAHYRFPLPAVQAALTGGLRFTRPADAPSEPGGRQL